MSLDSNTTLVLDNRLCIEITKLVHGLPDDNSSLLERALIAGRMDWMHLHIVLVFMVPSDNYFSRNSKPFCFKFWPKKFPQKFSKIHTTFIFNLGKFQQFFPTRKKLEQKLKFRSIFDQILAKRSSRKIDAKSTQSLY